MTDLTATLTAFWKGKQATTAAERDVDGFAQSVKASALEQQIAADKTSKLSAKTKELARSVAAGEKSLDSAENELKQYSKQLGIAEKETTQLDHASASNGQSFSGLATKAALVGGALVTVGAAAKEAYGEIKEGAGLLAAEEKFDNLSASIGATGDMLENRLATATKGLLSGADLIASASDIMSLELAKTESGVVRMATAVGALNLDMQVLALTLANDSTARLDNLGLSLEAVTAKKKELIASGFIGDAFDEAVLIELEKKMTLLGDASETPAGKIQITEVAFTNFFNMLKTEAALVTESSGAIDSAVGVVERLTERKERLTKASADLEEATRLGMITEDGAVTIYRQLARGSEYYEERMASLTIALDENREASAAISNTAAEVEEIMLQRRQTTLDNAEAERLLTVEKLSAIETSGNYADVLYDDAEAATAASDALMAAAKEATALTVAQLEGIGVFESSISIIDGYNQLMDRSAEATQTAAGRQQEYRDTQASFQDSVDISAQRVENLAMKLLGIPPSVSSTVTVDTSAAEAAIGSLERKLFGIQGAAGAGANVSTSASPQDPFAPNSGGLATGGSTGGGGSFLVGETGPERVTLPGNSYVTNAQDLSNHNTTINTSSPYAVLAQMGIQRRRV